MSLGIVTEHLISLIAKQVNDNGLVVWYDPDGEYAAALPALNPQSFPFFREYEHDPIYTLPTRRPHPSPPYRHGADDQGTHDAAR